MDSLHNTRALNRGLQILAALNQHNGALVSEVARATGLARTTAFRLLESLCAGGYIRRDPADDRYRLTIKVRQLSAGFEESAWITEIVAPVVEGLAEKISWPVYVSTLYGTSMLVRYATTFESRLSIDTYSTGTLVPLLQSGAGKAFLAFCGPDRRAALLAILERSDDPDHLPARDRESLAKTLRKTRAEGYAVDHRERLRRNPGRTSSIAVPIISQDKVIAALSLRYLDAAMPLDSVAERYLPRLRETAGHIGRAVAAGRR